MFKLITDPKTGESHKINSEKGTEILKNYLSKIDDKLFKNQLGGDLNESKNTIHKNLLQKNNFKNSLQEKMNNRLLKQYLNDYNGGNPNIVIGLNDFNDKTDMSYVAEKAKKLGLSQLRNLVKDKSEEITRLKKQKLEDAKKLIQETDQREREKAKQARAILEQKIIRKQDELSKLSEQLSLEESRYNKEIGIDLKKKRN